MDRMTVTKALRARTDRQYNCCQSVLIPFCPETGLGEEEAYALGAPFGGGMHCGSVCGALTGGLMVLGLLGYDKEVTNALMERFRLRHGAIDCKDLLSSAARNGVEKKTNCDGLVLDMVADLEEFLKKSST